MTVEELLSYCMVATSGKYRRNMIIFPCVANDAGRKILHSLDPIQVEFRGVAPDITTVI